jgi:hypothetical protein
MVILGIYLLAGAVAAALLWLAGIRRWYWHVIAALAGFVVGLVPPPGGAGGDGFYTMAGAISIFLIVWGIGAAVIRLLRVPAGVRHSDRSHMRAA